MLRHARALTQLVFFGTVLFLTWLYLGKTSVINLMMHTFQFNYGQENRMITAIVLNYNNFQDFKQISSKIQGSH